LLMRNKENNVNLVERNGVWFEVNSQEPFTGVAESFYGNGQLQNKIDMKAGLQDGLFELYYPNGLLHQKVNMKAGLQDGLFEDYYEDGEVKEKSNFKAGVGTETIESNVRAGSIIWKIVKYALYALGALFIFAYIYGSILMSDPCDISNWDYDTKNHYAGNGWFSSKEELERWRSECLFKD
jgi:hypothetical protein